MEARNEISDAPIYSATLEDMEYLPNVIAKLEPLLNKFGGVRIDPPQN